MYNSNYLYHSLKLNPTSLVTYPVFMHGSSVKRSNESSFESGGHQVSSYQGKINNKSASKIIRAINTLFDISNKQYFNNKATGKRNYFVLNFITLTLSSVQGKITDKEIMEKCFSKFMRVCRRKYGLKHYVWKAERQKNNNIHFHITTNCYIRQDNIRNLWNECQKEIGFIDLFQQKHKHNNPNSTDVKIVSNKNMLGGYLAKYVSKIETEKRGIGGKVWDCSKSLKNVAIESLELAGKVERELSELLATNEHKIIDKDFVGVYILKNKRTKNILQNEIRQHYSNWLQEVRTFTTSNKNDKQQMECNKQKREGNMGATNRNHEKKVGEVTRLYKKSQLEFKLVNY